ncbi:MAG: aminotransferase class IV [Actinobacteria bacterium]|nr:aminotransferase class IV [Actinomycetota bacterium]
MEGSYLPIAEARIPILDTGFVRSDLTYDVVAVWGGKFFRLDDHLDRLERGCERVRLRSPMSRAETEEILEQVVARSGLREAYVETVITRGVPTPGERDPRRFENRLYAYAIPYVWIQRPEQQEVGSKVVVARDTVRVSPGAIDPTVKNFMWGDFVRGLFEAYDRGAVLPILTDGDGNVTEGPGVNVFVVRDGALATPARGVLEGITRQTVLDIATELGIPARVGEVPVSALYETEEIFLTSTAGGVMPVAELDGRPVGAGGVGSLSARIRATYWDWHDDPRFTRSVDYGD